ncbi:MAG: riboflavin biosynthesis protein RibF [Betaproteobacteria bacterium RIFCSPLOWO2_02_FULL_62_17]|nr:MAG: riboflavin biosynthesis protein RibF [Betaproteobacteria bacterium RIFCSPLOWO2_02_FULL_62_17]
MLVTRGATRAGHTPVALTIGNFDGVHKGHQAILSRLVHEARERALCSCVMTFEPHPREFFGRIQGKPEIVPTRLTSLREKLELLDASGVERVHVQRFSKAFAELTPDQFVHELLDHYLGARWVLIGDDFCFGRGRAGNFALLRRLGGMYGIEVQAMGTVAQDGARVSSVAVRAALTDGDLARASLLLGRAYSISGRVVHGDKFGRELGFPTANIQIQHNRPPLLGIFAVRMHGIAAHALPGVASLGVRPTVTSAGTAVLEVHLFDFTGDLYGRHLRVEFLHKIRDEAKYPDIATLRAQIARDCEDARNLLMEKSDG